MADAAAGHQLTKVHATRNLHQIIYGKQGGDAIKATS